MKEKGKVSQSESTHESAVAAEIRAMRLTRNAEVELIKTRIDLEREKLQRNAMKMKEKMLPQLLSKKHLSLKDEEMKRQLIKIRRDATGRVGLASLQKCTGAMRVLTYGTSSDVVDEYLRMSSSSTRDALVHFVEGVISCFGGTYLRRPNEEDLARLLYVREQLGFPGMIDSIDCMHWEWKNCPNAWAGQYIGRSGKPTIILEAVASYDLWIWHAYTSTSCSLNTKSLFEKMLSEHLEFYKLDLHFYDAHVLFGTKF
ncbi:uncharacterized protein LOC130990792 [Salvia miltiorrhiza]|uniref:uncharacterized protein LOC130990792 n=1 Tax=Salvia miltiorrhiza TaxID=226208 RepID=UPI0025AB8AD1|nr:uncharacterized protein LOC130990792 [Salvia miltiorrhiza]